MIQFLARIFGYLMNWCYALLPNWVAAIALFTLVTKILLVLATGTLSLLLALFLLGRLLHRLLRTH